MKIQQNEKSARKLNKKSGRQIRKNKPKISKFSKNTPNMPLAVHRNSKSAINVKKSNPQNRILPKTSPKNKQITIKTSSKTSNPQAFKKNRNSTKNKPKFAGKPHGWQHCIVI